MPYKDKEKHRACCRNYQRRRRALLNKDKYFFSDRNTNGQFVDGRRNPLSEEHKAKISAGLRKRFPVPFCHKKYRETHREEFKKYNAKYLSKPDKKELQLKYKKEHPFVAKESYKAAKKAWTEKNKERRSKEYKIWHSKNRDLLRAKHHNRLILEKNAGELTVETIQRVYEDNIKKYGTLTCYLCLNLIPFKKDHLEHKYPLSRGGTNLYENLAVACQRCNITKKDKTEEEYRHYLEVTKI